MLYLEKSIKTLEFDKILTLLSEIAQTPGAKKRALALLPTANINTVKKRQNLTSDAKNMAGRKGAPSFGSMPEIPDILEKAEKNSVLSPREILDVASVLHSSYSLLEYIRSDEIERCELTSFFEALVPNKSLEDRILKAIISEDLIADEASSKLADIRRKIRYQTNRIRELLQGYLSGERAKSLRDTVITIRNGRYVLPVKTENKNEIKGLIHDTSGTGATLFIEPLSVVEANNELRTLMIEEQVEIEKILSEFSSEIAGFSMQLMRNYNNITEIAFYFACSELSYKMNATEPIINDRGILKFEKARHPLLEKEKVVPIDIWLGNNFKMLVVTGPNTGGKTVTLKTLGLFSLMAQSGLHLPCEYAEIPVFDGVFPDIGDEQSIEQSLSTFSSHIVSIVKILNCITKNSLVLLDELGAGTDPVEGAALAQSVLEKILSVGCLCSSTTHYAELKAFALDTKGVSNASCEFNINTLKPTYKLIIGSPGKSNAFLISEKLGVSNDIISRAKELISDDSRSFENVISKLEQQRIALEEEKEKEKKSREEFEEFRKKAETELKNKLENSQKEYDTLLQKAQQTISGARAGAEFIFSQLDKIQKEKDKENFSEKYSKTKKDLRAKLQKYDDIFNPVEEIDENYVLPRELVKGDSVIIRNLGKEGFLLENPDKSGNVNVQFGNAKIKTNIKNLALAEKKANTSGKGLENGHQSQVKRTVSGKFAISLDVRGKNVEEAWADIDKYLDEALLYKVDSVTIVHGKGTGALRKGLWEFFRKDSRIKKYRNGEYGEGDYGVTVINLK